MDTSFRAETGAGPHDLFVVVSDLTTYPSWIDVVHRVEPVEDETIPAGDRTGRADDGRRWLVTLRAELGPLARSKRLRMARTAFASPADNDGHGFVRFDRRETDGRHHAPWTMQVTVEPGSGSAASVAICRLHYGGGLWNGLLAGSLDLVARRSVSQLQQLVGRPG